MYNDKQFCNLICQSFLIRFDPTSLTAMFISIMQIWSPLSIPTKYLKLRSPHSPHPHLDSHRHKYTDLRYDNVSYVYIVGVAVVLL